MRLMLYYMIHSFINAIKKLFRSWVVFAFIGCISFGAIVGFSVAMIGKYVDNQQEQTSDITEDFSEDTEEDDLPKTPEEWQEAYEYITLVIFALTMLILITNIYPMKNAGERMFSMADINLLMTSPLSPQTLILYKTIQQMGLMVVSTIYIMFQIPNLIINLNVPLSCAFSLIGVWLLMTIFCKLSGILAYATTAGNERAKGIVRWAIWIMLAILTLAVLYTMKCQSLTGWEAAKTVIVSKPVMQFPMIGWIAGIGYAALTQNFSNAGIYLALLLVGMIVMVYIIWHVKVDFYEDCITKATLYHEKMEASKEGIKVSRQQKKKVKREEIGKGFGANCFLYNQLYNRKRFAKLGVITNTGIVYMGLSILASILLRNENGTIGENSFFLVGILFLIICYNRNYGNPIAMETTTSFLYMIPEKAFSKIGYSILGSTIIAGMDIFPAMLIAGIIMKISIVEGICWFLLLISFDFILSNTGLLIDLLLPTYLIENIKVIFGLFFKLLGIIPIAVCIPISTIFPPALLIAVLLNIAWGLIFMIISSKLMFVGKA